MIHGNNIKKQIVRPEFNLVKFSNFIFPHPNTHGLDQERIKSWDVKLPNGETAKATVEVAPTTKEGIGVLTTRSYAVLSALFYKLHESGQDPFKEFEFTLREIAQIMGKPVNGKTTNIIAQELRALSLTAVTWRTSYKTKNNRTGGTLEDMHILSHLQFKSDGMSKDDFFTGVKTVSVQFYSRIAKNIQDNYCIPCNYDVYKSLNTYPYAQIFYNKLCLYLSSSNYRSQALSAIKILEILEITAKRYQYKSNRKELLEELVTCLNGKPISHSGRIIKLRLAQTNDLKDYKLIIAVEHPTITNQHKHYLPIINQDEAEIGYLMQRITEALKVELDITAQDIKTLKRYCQVYPKALIERAIGDYKELYHYKQESGDPVREPLKYFSSRVHYLAHDSGYPWVKDCGVDCRYRNKA